MCRHLAYAGPPVPLTELVVEPKCGLYEQSWAPRRQLHGNVNADGFGLGWYPDPDDPEAWPPARYRRAVPIWADPNLSDLARTIRSGCVLAAVRDATPGTAQDETAAAPYAEGRWLFSHNGAVPDWQHLLDDLDGLAAFDEAGSPEAGGAGERLDPHELLSLESRCDSALVWALLLRRLRAGESAPDALAALTSRISAVRPGARLNFLLTDGHTITAARRGDTLWYRVARGGVVVASEPDDDRTTGDWQEVPDDSLLVATATSVRTVPLVPAAERIPIP
jgi:ergothioneine biosynthesis protein EgtC